MSKKPVYHLPLFDRFDFLDKVVTKDDVLLSIELSLQDLLNKFIHEVQSITKFELNASKWNMALAEFLQENETRLLNIRIINTKADDGKATLRIALSAMLCYDKTNVVMTTRYGNV